MGNEMGNSNVSGLQDTEKANSEFDRAKKHDFDGANKSSEVNILASDENNAEAEEQQVLSPKKKDSHEKSDNLIPEDSSGIEYPHSDNEMEPITSSGDRSVEVIPTVSEKKIAETGSSKIQDKREPEATEVQAPDGFIRTPLVSNHTLTCLSSEDGSFHEIDQASDKNLSETSDIIQETQSFGTDTEQATSGSSVDLLILDNLSDKGTKVFFSLVDGLVDDRGSAFQNIPSETSSNKIHDERATQEPDITVALAPGGSSLPLMSNDAKDEEIQSISSPEDRYFDETATASSKNTSETSDHQVQDKILEGREDEKIMKVSSDITSKTVTLEFEVATYQNSEQLKPDNMPYMECGSMLQRSDLDTLGSSGPHDYEEKEKKSIKETQDVMNGSAFSISKSELEKLEDDMQRKYTESQRDTLLDMSKKYERKLEIVIGADNGETLEPELDVENGDNREELLKANLERIDSTDPQHEAVPVTRSLESCPVENFQSKDKFVVLTDNTNVFENEFGIEQNSKSPNVVSLSVESGEEANMKTKMYSSEHITKVIDHEDDNEGMRTGEGNMIDNAIHDRTMSSLNEKETDLEKEEETYGEEASPTDFTVVNTNPEIDTLPLSSLCLGIEVVVHEKRELGDNIGENAEETEILKLASFNLDPIEQGRGCHVPSVEIQPQDATEMLKNRRKLNFELEQDNFGEVDVGKTSHAEPPTEEHPMKLESQSVSTDQSQGPEEICKLSDSIWDIDSDIDTRSAGSNESYSTAYEQENLSTDICLDNSIVRSVPAMLVEHIEVEHRVGSLTTELYSEEMNINSISSMNGRAEIPLQCEEKIISVEVLSPTYESKVGVSIGSLGAETELSALKGDEEKSGEKPTQDQISEEKQVITSGRTSSENLNIPLLSFLKEESYRVGSQQEQERLVTKKAIADKSNSHNGTSTATTQRGVKRKPKTLFFSICICCTPNIS